MKRWLIPAIITVSILVAVICVRGVVEGYGHLDRAEKAMAAGDRQQAQVEYLNAARWYVPGSPVVRTALEALGRLASESMEAGDYARAVSLYDDMRGAVHATAHMWVPNADLLAIADAGQAEALAAWDRQLRGDSARPVDAFASAIGRAGAGVSIWLLIMGLAFCGYIGCLCVIAWKWDEPSFKKTKWFIGSGVLFVAWIVSMILA